MTFQAFSKTLDPSVADPHGSGIFAWIRNSSWIRIRNKLFRIRNTAGSGSLGLLNPDYTDQMDLESECLTRLLYAEGGREEEGGHHRDRRHGGEDCQAQGDGGRGRG